MSKSYILSEKAETKNSTIDTFEEIYTQDDTFDNSFQYPLRWLEWPSHNKKIAIRRLEAEPREFNFRLILNSYLKPEGSVEDMGTVFESFLVEIGISESTNIFDGLLVSYVKQFQQIIR